VDVVPPPVVSSADSFESPHAAVAPRRPAIATMTRGRRKRVTFMEALRAVGDQTMLHNGSAEVTVQERPS
jgi:hypothetical protein